MQALLPWPPRWQRRQAIAQARRDRIAAERRMHEAREVEDQLRRAVSDNHIAEMIARQLRGNP